MQIAGQAERMAAGIDELLQRLGALEGIADNGDAGADYVGYYSGENSSSANRPQLVVTYQ